MRLSNQKWMKYEEWGQRDDTFPIVSLSERKKLGKNERDWINFFLSISISMIGYHDLSGSSENADITISIVLTL